MAQPTNKSPQINQFLSSITGKDRVQTITEDRCTTCNDPDMNFRTNLDRKEYTISGMCQKCQDAIFGKE